MLYSCSTRSRGPVPCGIDPIQSVLKCSSSICSLLSILTSLRRCKFFSCPFPFLASSLCGSDRASFAAYDVEFVVEISRCRAPLHRSTTQAVRPAPDVELYSALQCSTVLYSTLQCSTALPTVFSPSSPRFLGAGQMMTTRTSDTQTQTSSQDTVFSPSSPRPADASFSSVPSHFRPPRCGEPAGRCSSSRALGCRLGHQP